MSAPDQAELNLLLFSVGGVHFGIDAEQVSDVHPYDGEQGEDLFWFHEELPCCDGSVPYASPTVIAIRTGDDRLCRVIIDAMEDFGTFASEDLRLFPALVEPFALRCGMWGVLPRGGKLVLLVDFKRLWNRRRSGASSATNREPGVPL